MSQQRIVSCPVCQTKMKVPHQPTVLQVVCIRCDARYDVPPAPVVQARPVPAQIVQQQPAPDIAAVEPATKPQRLSSAKSSQSPKGSAAATPRLVSPVPAWAKPLAAIVGVMTTVLVGVVIYMSSFQGGRSLLASLNPMSSSPERAATRLNQLLAEYEDVIEQVKTQPGRAPAAEQLDQIEGQLAQLVRKAALMDEVAKIRHREIVKLVDLGNHRQLAAARVKRRLEAGYPNTDALSQAMQRVNLAADAAQDVLLRMLVHPSMPNTSEVSCYRGLLLERGLVRSLATVEDTEDVPRLIDELQRLIDEYNQLAEKHAARRRRVELVPSDYEGIELAGENVRAWLIQDVRRRLAPGENYDQTLEDLEFVENRFNQALDAESLNPIGLTSAQRVRRRVSEQLVKGEATKLAQTPATGEAQGDVYDPLAGFASSRQAASQGAGDSASAKLASDGQTIQQRSGVNDLFGDESMDQKSSSPNSLVVQQDSKTGSQGVKAPLSAGDNGEKDDVGQSTVDDPGELPELLTGPSSLTVIVINWDKLDRDKLVKQMARVLSSNRYSVSVRDENLVFNFLFSGKMPEAESAIDFGTIDLVDRQSRTIFVDGQ